MKFEQSQYNKIWDSKEGRTIVTAILNNPDLIHANHTFWQSKFRIDPQVTPTNSEGEAVFKSKMRELDGGVLMDMRAPLGDSTPMDAKGIQAYAGSIPDFIAKGFVEKATERKYKEDLFDEFADARNLAIYATDVIQKGLDAANQTLSHMAAYLLSHGNLSYLQGEGIQSALYEAPVPSANFTTAGVLVWTDPNAEILTQIINKVKHYYDVWGVEIPLQLEVPRTMFDNCFVPNTQVINWVKHMYEVKNGVALSGNLPITADMALEELAKYPSLPKIVIVEEKQKDVVNGIVSGWDVDKAVLRPVGYAGYIRHTVALDEEMLTRYGNNVNSFNFTRALSGLVTIQNSVVVNGNFKEWHTDVMMSAIPSLDEFLYHVIIDTTTADS